MAAARAQRRAAMDAALPLGDLELTARVAASLAVPHKGMARDFTRTAWEIVDVTEKALIELPAGRAVAAGEPAGHARAGAGGLRHPGRGEQASLEARGAGPAERRPRAAGGGAQRAAAPVLRHHPGRRARGHRPRAAGGRQGDPGRSRSQALAHLVLMECAAAAGDVRRRRRACGRRRAAGQAVRPVGAGRRRAPGTPDSG